MAYRNLKEFISDLEEKGQLHRVTVEVDRNLEMAQIVDVLSKSGGPAVLFENVKNSPFPVLMNAFGSDERMCMALGTDSLSDIGERVEALMEMEMAEGILDKLKALPKLKALSDYMPKRVKSGPVKEVVEKENPSLNDIPVLKTWPGDGGPFITLPLVFTKDPTTGERNTGMYRMQVYDDRTTGMHWHLHKHGARHFREARKLGTRLEVAVALGGDPATIYSASAPLPDGVDEMFFAGFLRKKPVELIKCETVDLDVPAQADFILEGYVDPNEMRREGPFGDHTGYYSLADDYPVFNITCVTRRREPVYPATVVGKPPMEDCFMAKATERIFLPMLKRIVPEIVDINLPIDQAFKIMNTLWGTGQMMFTKIIVVVDAHVNVQDTSEVLWRLGNNVDPSRDILFTRGPLDVLDHSSPMPNFGSKFGVDATKKGPGDGHPREWPDDIIMDEQIVRLVEQRWKEYGF
jgi:4-hydroxy-3-polyprenylbenzoate decarboxylase